MRFLIGERDLAPGPLVAAELVTLFPRASVTMLPDSAHFPWVDQPAAFTAAIADALTER
ncbi:hypothetical protein GE115_02575 [Agromyces sp. CFH 90414]|uniref:Alpha/beta hydrolase n=1 Tax=Agromyces agglutinans TaxID=2662258 RepID=A0A6I2F2L7_9MICO|nr:hypothetical protein [Agromyces agglutinans]MRG58762.1 hypothetical protein [Agromyces agglutinans]